MSAELINKRKFASAIKLKADNLFALTKGYNTQNVIFINLINSTDNTKLSWYTLPPRQYHSFLRNLYPLYSFIIIKSQLELKTTTNNNNNNKNHHDSQRLTKCDPPYDFRDKDENIHTTHQHIVQIA